MSGLVDWLKAIGLAGFLFFLIKGLVWCVVFWLLSRGVIKKQAIARFKLRLRKLWRQRSNR